jgi:hypothetical protein
MRKFVGIGVLLIAGVFYTGPHNMAHAQALPALYRVASTFSQAVIGKVAKLGFAANDPRIAGTVEAMSAAASGFAQTAATGANPVVNAPWAVVGEVAGMAGLLLAPTPLADGSVDQWQFNRDGTITLSGNPHAAGGSVTPQFAPLTVGGTYWAGSSGSDEGFGANADAAAQAAAQAYDDFYATNGGLTETVTGCTPVTATTANCVEQVHTASGILIATATNGFQQVSTPWAGPACSTGLYYNNACQAYKSPSNSGPPPVETQTLSVEQAIAQIPSSDDNLPLSPDLMAALADSLWEDAASQPGYQGLPYPSSDPVTSADLAPAQQSNPQSWPSVGDFVAPQTSPSGSGNPGTSNPSSNPYSPPASTSPVSQPTNPGTGSEVNLGPDPGIGSPSLEEIPTASQILAPILSLLPDLRAYVVPSHTSQCPQPSITLFDQSFTFSRQCELAEQLRPEITGVCFLAFALSALFIVLTA